MRLLPVLHLLLAGLLAASAAETQRFIMDDDAYLDQVSHAAEILRKKGELVALPALRSQLKSQTTSLKLAPPQRRKLAPTEMYDRLRESTLAVGAFYKCPDCPEWHFDGATGFVVGEQGVVSTCCHLLLDPDKVRNKGYLIATDAAGHVFPVRSVLAADTESDTCLLKIDAAGLKPLPLRGGVRAGERIYCLSHPAGNHFMFSEGLVARVTRSRSERLEDAGKTNAALTRPLLFLNVTAEYAPGSSGAPIVDEAGNVVAQVVSLADAGEPDAPPGQEDAPPSPSVPLRFCITAEEMLRLIRSDASK